MKTRQPYQLPDEDCERLKRSEMDAVRMLLAVLSAAAYAKEDLFDRLECVPYGNQRMRLALGGLRAVCDDVVGTISKSQCKQIYGTMKDFRIELRPRLMPGSTNVVMTKEQGKELLDLARWQCHDCVKDGEECRQCRLYKIMEATTPLNDYGDGLVCPYALADWIN